MQHSTPPIDFTVTVFAIFCMSLYVRLKDVTVKDATTTNYHYFLLHRMCITKLI